MLIENVSPAEIERRSMEIIESELGDTSHLTGQEKIIVKRVIHTTADFDYLQNMKFSENAVSDALKAIKGGAVFVTDTNMVLAGISKPALEFLNCKAYCFTGDSDVSEQAKNLGITRSAAAIEKAVKKFIRKENYFCHW